MLDDSDAAHTKPIENYYGNFDRELKKAGAQGFNKASDNLIIEYSKDHIVLVRNINGERKLIERKHKNLKYRKENSMKSKSS